MAFSRLTAALSSLETSMDQTASRLRDHAASIRSSMTAAENAVRGAETRIAEGLDRARDKARQGSEEISGLVEQLLAKTGSQFDDLRNLLETASGPFAEELRLQLDLVELGGKSVQELITLFGKAEIGGKRVRDLLQGADFGKFRKDMQELLEELEKGALSFAEILKFLNQRGGDFGKTIAGWIESFKKGEISLQRLKELINNAESEFSGTPLADFLDEIEDAIDSGRL